MLIRDERPQDEDAIHRLIIAAFAPMAFSDGTEAHIVRSLRRSGDLTLSLVAEEDGVIVGHIAFSPVTIDGAHNGWFGLGPIAVRSDRQKNGIGKALVQRGLDRLKAQGARGCALIGDPAFYNRVGFECDRALSYRDVGKEYVQRLTFIGPSPRGELSFADAFSLDHSIDK